MEAYLEEIRDKGLETLEKFLLLLKEDMILFHSREKQKTQLTDEEFGLLYTEGEGSVLEKVHENNEIILNREDLHQIEERKEDYKKSSASQHLFSNAHFIYLFALLDQFILEIAKIIIRNKPERPFSDPEVNQLLDKLSND